MRTMTCGALVVAAVLLLSSTARAQPRFEASGGVHYGFQHPPVEPTGSCRAASRPTCWTTS